MINTKKYIISLLFIFAIVVINGNDIKSEKATNNNKNYYFEFGGGVSSMVGLLISSNLELNINQKRSASIILSGSYENPIFKSLSWLNYKYPNNFYLSSALLYNLHYKKFKLGAGISYTYGRKKTDEFLYSSGTIITNEEYFRYILYHVLGNRINLQYQPKNKTWNINIFCDLNPQYIYFGFSFNKIIKKK